MDKIKKYRRILKSVTEEHANIASPMNWVKSTAACDFGQNNYFLIDYDTREKKHYIVFHLRLVDGKIFVEQDGVEYGIVDDLVMSGVSAKDISSIFQAAKQTENVSLAA